MLIPEPRLVGKVEERYELMKILAGQEQFLQDKARTIAERIKATVTTDIEEVAGEDRYLRFDLNGLSLVQGKMELRGDFGQMHRRVLGGHLQHEKLLRAARWKGMPDDPIAVDATAGLGEDSFILAAAGFHVIMCEYNPVIAALLADALERAQNGASLRRGGRTDDLTGVSVEKRKPAVRYSDSFETEQIENRIREIANRMELITGNGIDILTSLEKRPDLIYLEPMFPAKQKSGISTKKLQLFQKLETPCAAEEELLRAAFEARPQRIVVKRPIKGEPLAGRRPGYAIECRNVRYDCYLL